jgi:hypothetical protein
MSEEKSYFCRTCEESDTSKFYDKRHNICKTCYSKKMIANKEKSKEDLNNFKKRVEILEQRVEDLEEEINKLKNEK